MAKVKRNALIQGISGTLGRDLVFRQMRDGSTIVSAKPNFNNRVFSQGQLTHQSRFQQAAAYARKAAKKNPIYAELAKGTTKTAYNVALSDWFNPPVIHRLERQTGRVRVAASDNVLVVKVQVTVWDEQDHVLERGEATPTGSGWWEYTLRATGRVTVEVYDPAGNVSRGTLD